MVLSQLTESLHLLALKIPFVVQGLEGVGTAILCGILMGVSHRSEKKRILKEAILICLGATVFAYASVLIPETVAAQSGQYKDPARLVAQVVSGFAFLGGVSLITSEVHVVQVIGTPMAATLWITGGIGILVGGGYPWLAVACSVILMVLMRTSDWVIRRLFVEKKHFQCLIELKPGNSTKSMGEVLEHQFAVHILEWKSYNPTQFKIIYECTTDQQGKLMDYLIAQPKIKAVTAGPAETQWS